MSGLGEGVAVPLQAPAEGKAEVVDSLVAYLAKHRTTLGEVWADRVAAFAQERRAFGMRKYGQPLRTFDGRPPHLDALQEAVDLVVYLHKAEMQYAELEDELEKVRQTLSEELHRTLQVQGQRDAERRRADRLEAEVVELRRALVRRPACCVHNPVGDVHNEEPCNPAGMVVTLPEEDPAVADEVLHVLDGAAS